MIKSFNELPQYLQIFLKKRFASVKDFDLEAYVHKKMQDLNDRSIIETINEPDGEEIIINLFNELTGLYGGPYLLQKPEKRGKC